MSSRGTSMRGYSCRDIYASNKVPCIYYSCRVLWCRHDAMAGPKTAGPQLLGITRRKARKMPKPRQLSFNIRDLHYSTLCSTLCQPLNKKIERWSDKNKLSSVAFKGGVSDRHMGTSLSNAIFFDARLTRQLIMKYR